MERERPILGLLLEKMPEVISVSRTNKRVELKMEMESKCCHEFGDCLEVAENVFVTSSQREFD